MKRKILPLKISFLLLILFISITSISGCSSKSLQTQIPTIKNFDETELKNKAVVILPKGGKIPKDMQDTLLEYSNQYNLDIAQVEYNSEVENYSKKQEKSVNLLNDLKSYDSKIQTLKDGSKDSKSVDDVYKIIDQAIDEKIKGKDNSNEIKAILSKSTVSEKDLLDYISGRVKYTSSFLLSPISEKELPQVFIFKDKENARINGFITDKKELDWFLIQKGLLNLNKTPEYKKVIENTDKGKTFVTLYVTNSCIYCKNIEEVFKQLCKSKNIEYVLVDINTIGNKPMFDTFLKNGLLKEDISGTPTVVYYKNGKYFSSFVGQKSKQEMENFLNSAK